MSFNTKVDLTQANKLTTNIAMHDSNLFQIVLSEREARTANWPHKSPWAAQSTGGGFSKVEYDFALIILESHTTVFFAFFKYASPYGSKIGY